MFTKIPAKLQGNSRANNCSFQIVKSNFHLKINISNEFWIEVSEIFAHNTFSAFQLSQYRIRSWYYQLIYQWVLIRYLVHLVPEYKYNTRGIKSNFLFICKGISGIISHFICTLLTPFVHIFNNSSGNQTAIEAIKAFSDTQREVKIES